MGKSGRLRRTGRRSSGRTTGMGRGRITRSRDITTTGRGDSGVWIRAGNGNLLNPTSLNRYNFVVGDPVNLNDPHGLDNSCPPGWVCQSLTVDEVTSGGTEDDSDSTTGSPDDGLMLLYQNDKGEAGELTDASTDSPENPCDDLAKKIDQLINAIRVVASDFKGLAQRYRQLPKMPPSELPTHIDEFTGRQKDLRRQLKQWNDNDCGNPPPGAQEWADKAVPQEIMNRVPPSNRVPPPPNPNVRRIG